MHDRIEQSWPLPSSSAGIQDRISQLEGLVISLMSSLNAAQQVERVGKNSSEAESSGALLPLDVENHVEAAISETDDQTQLSNTFGRISLENAETSYVGSAHWAAILDGVSVSHSVPLHRVKSSPQS